MKRNIFKSLLVALCVGFCAIGANAATSLFSDYGQIQNVQNYSTNPFWTPNAPYNQRLPQPVYVQGADLNADDCFRIVQSLVSAQCIARDNCKDTTLADIRPTIMVQLSNLPGNNYVSACSGFIDGVFESYVAQYGTSVPNRAVGFPTATAPNPNVNNDDNIQIQNPYKQTVPQWKQEIIERSNELQQLQQQNGAGSQQLSATDFPMTFDDLSFEERMALKSADYEQYKDMTAYVVPNFQNKDEWCKGKGANTPECKVYTQQAQNNNQGSNQKPPVKPDVPEELAVNGIDYVLPWYGILVVKKNSLDNVYNSDKPFISPNYMKQHKDKYFPENSGKVLGMAKGCTHGNHTANDNDVINLAAHKTMSEENSFFTGNDYYVYDGEDVYWGTAMMVGEIALTLISLGVSAEAKAMSLTATNARAASEIGKIGKSTKNTIVAITDTQKAQKAAEAAKALTKTSTAADKAKVIQELKDAGITVSNRVGYRQLQQIGTIISNASSKVSWTSALIHGNKWRLLKNGATRIVPKAKNIFSSGASIGRTLAIGALAYGGVKTADSFSDTAHDIFVSVLKANGYSTATVPITDNPQYKDLKFNSFGLLSADNIEGHENDVSHGTWLQFDSTGEIQLGDAENEAAAFAEAFAEDVRIYNKETPLCDIDIFVVQPVIGDPLKTGKKDIYYLLYTDPKANLRVESHKK